ncbi:MAG: NTP transferase domain-containing protein [Chloroflexi bacterium]|nr:NTP transferase domain-containing protein [Chloroflexota bacterium]
MKAVILAAGEGKRMFPLTENRAKVMLPVAGKPLLEHLLLELREAGIHEFMLVVGYHSENVRQHFGSGSRWGVELQYTTQKHQRGTADALRHAVDWVGGPSSDSFLLANGDVLCFTEDVLALARHHGTALSLAQVEDVSGLGVVEVSGTRILRIHEKAAKPAGKVVNAGLYLLEGSIFEAISETGLSRRGEYELTDSLQLLIDRGQPVVGHMLTRWMNFTYPWDLLDANQMLLERQAGEIAGTIEPGAILNGSVSVGEGTIVRAGSYLIGPVAIGKDCDVGPNCYIRPATSVGDHCHIGASVEVKNSIIMDGSRVPHLNYVGDSIIGENCNLGAGAITANLRMDNRPVASMGVNTRRRKLGAIIGDDVQIGINASINPGCAIGSRSMVGPGAAVSGTLRPGTRAM